MSGDIYSGSDFILVAVYVAGITLIGRYIQKRKERNNPIYRFFVRGLLLKILGAIGLSTIYIFYYGGGDTIGFFESSKLLSKLFSFTPETYWSILKGNLSNENLYEFGRYDLCCPDYYRDPQSFAVVRIASVMNFFGLFRYYIVSILFAALSYGGVWRLFLLFNELYPGFEKKIAISVLYLPSLIFWGSGILKDTITFSAVGWFTYAVYMIFIKKQKRIQFSAILYISSYLLIAIKPYIFVALLPGTGIWISYARVSRLKSNMMRLVVAPFTMIFGLFLSSFILSNLSSTLGVFGDVDTAMNKAVVTQSDLSRDVYGKNSFNIGKFDGTVSGAITKFPQAVIAGIFRPFLWEARSVIILVSAIENSFLLFITIRVLILGGFLRVVKRVFNEPLLLFSMIFSIFFSFSVGLSTSNFGALVRYKIPCIPFYLSSMFILERPRMTVRINPEEITDSQSLNSYEAHTA